MGKDALPVVHSINTQADFEKACLSRLGVCAVAMLTPDAFGTKEKVCAFSVLWTVAIDLLGHAS